jgi:hypothetical protein
VVVLVALVVGVTAGSASAAAALSARNRSNSLLVSDSSGTVTAPPDAGYKNHKHLLHTQTICLDTIPFFKA